MYCYFMTCINNLIMIIFNYVNLFYFIAKPSLELFSDTQEDWEYVKISFLFERFITFIIL